MLSPERLERQMASIKQSQEENRKTEPIKNDPGVGTTFANEKQPISRQI